MAGLAVAALALGLVEVLLRLALGPPPAPVEVHGVPVVPEGLLRNEGGLVIPAYQMERVGSFPAAGPADRIAFLGGSTVHGGSRDITAEQEFPALVGARMGRPAVNLGQPAMDSHDLLALVEVLRDYPFAAWVVTTGHNDFGNVLVQARFKGEGGRRMALARRLFEHSALYVLLRRQLPQPPRKEVSPRQRGRVHEEQLRIAARYLEGNLERIAWIARSAGVPLLLVLPAADLQNPPMSHACPEEPCALDIFREADSLRASDPDRARALYEQARDRDAAPMRVPSMGLAAVRAAAASAGVPLVDLPRDLPRQAGLDLVDRDLFHDPVHLNEEGHRATAALIAEALVPLLDPDRDQ